MPRPDLYTCYKSMRQNNILLELNGMMSQEILVGFVELIQEKLSQEIENRKIIRRVFSVFVEVVQNVLHYAADSVESGSAKHKISTGIVVLSDDDDYYIISSGNLVDNARVPGLVNHCEKINQLDKQQLKDFYKEQIKAPQAQDSCGAGIGLIDMARTSGNPLSYDVSVVDSDLSFLTLSVKVKKEA